MPSSRPSLQEFCRDRPTTMVLIQKLSWFSMLVHIVYIDMSFDGVHLLTPT